MPEKVTLSVELTDEEWLTEIEEIGQDRGYFEPIGPSHAALFLDESLDILLVSFDTVASARAGSEAGVPYAMSLAEANGWSHLSLLSRKPTWFRDPDVWGYFDRLVDDAFFEDFERVIFVGSGLCGYAAAAFSVAAPGATVITMAPQATLNPAVAAWDDRFIGQRRADFTSRYGYAPDMVEAADQVFVIYDPTEELDAMHAALFHGPHVSRIRFRHGGPRIGDEVRAMNMLAPILVKAARRRLTPLDFYRELRRRRTHMPYLRNLLNRVHVEERHYLTALLCRAVVERTRAPRFRHHLEMAEQRLAEEGLELPAPLHSAGR